MKKLALLPVLLLLLSLASCGVGQGDWFAAFRGDFCAEIDGTWREQPICARVSVTHREDGSVATATVTFYAPAALAGTVLTQDGEGALTLRVGELCRPAPAGYGTLLALFPTAGEVREVSLDGDITTVRGEGFSFSLDGSGVPTALSSPDAAVRVVSFEKGA